MRIAWVTPAAPPSGSGQSRVLGALLHETAAEDSILFTDDFVALESDRHACAYVPLPQRARFRGSASRGPRAYMERLADQFFTRATFLHIRACARVIERTLRRRPVEVVVGCTGSSSLLPAAWVAARRLGLPFVAYLFDDPVTQWPKGRHRWTARSWERRWSRTAAAVIATNETLAADVHERSSAACVVVRNAISPSAFATGTVPWPAKSGEVKLVYTGAIYHAHYDAFVNLLRALDDLPLEATLHVYSRMDETHLRSIGIDGRVVYHAEVDAEEAHRIQQCADILFLPLAFNSPRHEVVRSASPGKLGEYLAAERPVLVHAPADSFVVAFQREHDWGFVADTPAPDALKAAILQIQNDSRLREAKAARAREVARWFATDVVGLELRRLMADVVNGRMATRSEG